MAFSVDGRTQPLAPQGAAASVFERVHDELAVEAWLVGRVTGQEFAKPPPVSSKKLSARTLVRATGREGLGLCK
jgi:hypothetical protein